MLVINTDLHSILGEPKKSPQPSSVKGGVARPLPPKIMEFFPILSSYRDHPNFWHPTTTTTSIINAHFPYFSQDESRTVQIK